MYFKSLEEGRTFRTGLTSLSGKARDYEVNVTTTEAAAHALST